VKTARWPLQHAEFAEGGVAHHFSKRDLLDFGLPKTLDKMHPFVESWAALPRAEFSEAKLTM
jgi:hypothetical protein